MGSRDVLFDQGAKCDICGKQGAFDFMGDYLCPSCAQEVMPLEPCNRCGHKVCICGLS